MIQAEATILGFFGKIVTYILASYDARLDRLEHQRFDLEIAQKLEKAVSVSERTEGVKDRKMKTALGIGLIGLVLIVSSVMSIVILGMRDLRSDFARNLSLYDLAFFFLAIFGMLLMFLRISKEPEEPKNIKNSKWSGTK